MRVTCTRWPALKLLFAADVLTLERRVVQYAAVTERDAPMHDEAFAARHDVSRQISHVRFLSILWLNSKPHEARFVPLRADHGISDLRANGSSQLVRGANSWRDRRPSLTARGHVVDGVEQFPVGTGNTHTSWRHPRRRHSFESVFQQHVVTLRHPRCPRLRIADRWRTADAGRVTRDAKAQVSLLTRRERLRRLVLRVRHLRNPPSRSVRRRATVVRTSRNPR